MSVEDLEDAYMEEASVEEDEETTYIVVIARGLDTCKMIFGLNINK